MSFDGMINSFRLELNARGVTREQFVMSADGYVDADAQDIVLLRNIQPLPPQTILLEYFAAKTRHEALQRLNRRAMMV